MKPIAGILLDLDGTVYPYEPTHRAALTQAFRFLADRTATPLPEIEAAFRAARQDTHRRLPDQGARHHRLLYFLGTLERLGKNAPATALEATRVYWDTFVSHLQPCEWFLAAWPVLGRLPVCFVTDLVTEIQIRKLEHLRLLEHPRVFLVTSEETGHEKPHPINFYAASRKLGIPLDSLCMIGDDFEKDILGADALGCKTFWYAPEGVPRKAVPASTTVFTAFSEIREFFHD